LPIYRLCCDLAEASARIPGRDALLERYHRARHAEVLARVTGIDALNRASMAEAQGLRDMRMKALNALFGGARAPRVDARRARRDG
jgi:2-octaprenyl-6-methoxyphenol hydroxylase